MYVFTEILLKDQTELWKIPEEISNSIAFIPPFPPTQPALFTADWA